MASADSDTAIESFLELERRFEEFVRVVPIAPEHNRVHSPVLASILLDSCSLLETVLKSSMDNSRYNGIANIAAIRAKRYSQTPPYLNIGDLRTVFRPDMFYVKPVWYLPRGESSFPWYAWRRANGHPSWWDAYNSVKHSRFQNAPQATLMKTLHALKGLFLALVQALEFRDRIIDRGLLRCSLVTANQLHAHAIAWEPIPVQWQPPIVVSTRLFGYKFLAAGSPARATDATVFL
jgi:hypothetical protein